MTVLWLRPTSPGMTWSLLTTVHPPRQREPTNLALLRGPSSSGYVSSFLRLRGDNATPSTSASRGLADPSQRKAETKVVSRASCAPPNNGSPSATTSRRPSYTSGALKSRSFTMTLEDTLAPPSRLPGGSALEGEAPPPQHSWSGARCAMVAKHVGWTATSAGARDRREGQTEAAQQQHPEQVRLYPRGGTGRGGRESQSSSWTALRPEHGLLIVRQSGENAPLAVFPFDT